MEQGRDYFDAARDVDSFAAFRNQAAMQRVKQVFDTLIRFSLVTLVVPFTVISDLVLLGNRLGERSITEWSQALLLVVTAILSLDAARHEPRARGLFQLMAGFFTCMAIRELDLFFDEFFYHGAWLVFALGVTGIALVATWRQWRYLVASLALISERRSFPFYFFGLVVVFILSRSLGSGRLLWDMLGVDDTHRLFKTIIQESLESFGYLLLAYGAIRMRREQEQLIGK